MSNMPHASITVDARSFETLLNTIAGNLDFTKGKLGKKVAAILREDARRQFAAGGEPRWAALSPRTIQIKERLGYPRRNRFGEVPRGAIQRGSFGPGNILLRTLALFSSWTDETDPHNVERITKDAVLNGSDLEYAGTMQEGYTGPLFGNPRIQGTIPARPIRITDRAKREIAELLENEITE